MTTLLQPGHTMPSPPISPRSTPPPAASIPLNNQETTLLKEGGPSSTSATVPLVVTQAASPPSGPRRSSLSEPPPSTNPAFVVSTPRFSISSSSSSAFFALQQRSKSFAGSASGFTPSSCSQEAAMATTTSQHRQSLPARNASHSRFAQLALLAEQSKLASIGTSNLAIANVTQEALQRAVDAAKKGKSTSDASTSAEVTAAAEAASAPSPTSSMASTSSSAPLGGPKDSAWENALTSPEFLASASDLANMFMAQEQSRKEWAGQALELQHRRWTMTAETLKPTGPEFKGKGKRLVALPEDGQSAGDDRPAMNDKRWHSAEDLDDRKRRRVSFAPNTLEDDDEPPSPTSGSAPPAVAATAGGSFLPTGVLKSALVSNRSARASLPAAFESTAAGSGSRPQLMANVLSSFATLLDTRQQACGTLAALAKSGDEMLTSTSSVAASATPSGAASPSAADTSAIADSESSSDDENTSTSSALLLDGDAAGLIREEPRRKSIHTPAPASAAFLEAIRIAAKAEESRSKDEGRINEQSHEAAVSSSDEKQQEEASESKLAEQSEKGSDHHVTVTEGKQ